MRNGKGECLLERRQKMRRGERVGCLTLGSQGGGMSRNLRCWTPSPIFSYSRLMTDLYCNRISCCSIVTSRTACDFEIVV